MDAAGYSPREQSKIADNVVFYIRLKATIGQASGDEIDFKRFEPGMRHLIDTYVVASDAKPLGIVDDFTLLDFIMAQKEKLESEGRSREAAAEAIENNTRRKIVAKMPLNPMYFAKMSKILEQIILDRKKDVIKYESLLERYAELARNTENPENNSQYPERIRRNGALRMFYDNCGQDEELALKLDRAVNESKQDGFRTNQVKQNRIKQAIHRILNDVDEVNRLFKLIMAQEEY